MLRKSIINRASHGARSGDEGVGIKSTRRAVPRTALMAALVLATAVSALSWLACDGVPNGDTRRMSGGQGQPGTVYLRIDLPDAPTRKLQATIEANTTVLNVMDGLRESGSLAFGAQGAGADTLIDEIAGVRNGKTDGPYWIYAVNGRLADRGVGQLILSAGDRVRWCYLKYEAKDRCAEH